MTATSSLNPRASRRILYITFDGLLEPLGRSQVLSYLYGLSELGYSYTLISLERQSDLSDTAAVCELKRELANHNINWICLDYRAGGAKAAFGNYRRALRAAREVITRDRPEAVHARSYLAAMVGRALHRIYGVPFIFDMRGYWIDELADDGRWFTNPLTYRAGKFIERKLLKDSSAVVTLTNLQAEDLRASLLKQFPEKPVEVVTTCADYEEFDGRNPPRRSLPSEIEERLRGKLTIGLVGSINASYRLPESFFLFRCLLEERPDAHLIWLTRQVELARALVKEHEIPEGAYTLTTARHQDMSDWLRRMDWALLLLETRYSKRGSMPTKLAEFFAAGVRPIQYGCNPEVSQKVLEAGSGIVLRGLSPEHLREAARDVAARPLRPADTDRAREATRGHFSLEAGVERYAALLTRLHRGAVS